MIECKSAQVQSSLFRSLPFLFAFFVIVVVAVHRLLVSTNSTFGDDLIKPLLRTTTDEMEFQKDYELFLEIDYCQGGSKQNFKSLLSENPLV